ncbi:hypothetical protein F5X68DRAFT_239145 [Plectosphaerella plurivora]|uniref:Uncharacterized protein n=1 Tax=Plectosphaerella plurivora TaxID=936078 RepID=A0A9P8VCL0_9PEZI|nr:hypothetical protein F5X68DRAFT_239145 [Plectosphaerella plurivora]
MSVYSTILSGIWFVVAVFQPRWGRVVATSGGTIEPSTASVVCALLAKTIELTFVTVFISFLGQALTRRSFVRKSKGITLAEMMMRNWVIQPGSLITHFGTFSYGVVTFLGVLTLMATLASMFYTTASDALVSPKLLIGDWERREMLGKARSTYANPLFAAWQCRTPLWGMDPVEAGGSCLNMQYSADSYGFLMPYLAAWDDFKRADINQPTEMHVRRGIRTTLQENVTLVAKWVETENSDVLGSKEQYGRIINNVTLAIPHPGLYSAATDKTNKIMQPQELSNVGEYYIKASVVSPVVNIMCVNMAPEELAPLIYTTWPNAKVENITFEGQIGHSEWYTEIPVMNRNEYLNRTVVDDVFKWGAQYQRRPPVFQLVSAPDVTTYEPD